MSGQRITTDDVGRRRDELGDIIDKNYMMGNAVINGIDAMNIGITENMQYNMSSKVLCVSRSLRDILQTLNQGKNILQNVIDAYELTDDELKKKVEENETFMEDVEAWVGDVEVVVTFERRVQLLKEKEGFRQGDVNTNNFMNGVDYYEGSYIGAKECCAMARMMQVEVMGKRGYDTGLRSWDDVQVGDVIHYSGGGAAPSHWVFVTEVQGDKIIISEGNWVKSTVTHGREIPKGSINILQIDRIG